MCDVVMPVCEKYVMWPVKYVCTGDIVGGMCTYVCVYGYVSVYHEWEPGLPTEGKSTIQDYIYRDTAGNPLGPGHWAFTIWSTFKKEQLDVGRSLVAMSHVKQKKELGRFGLDENRGEWGGERREGWHCPLGRIMKVSTRFRKRDLGSA